MEPGYAFPVLRRHPLSNDHHSLWKAFAASSVPPPCFLLSRSVATFPQKTPVADHSFMPHFRLNIRITFIHKNSLLQMIFTHFHASRNFSKGTRRRAFGGRDVAAIGKFSCSISQSLNFQWDAQRQALPARIEKVMEFRMRKMISCVKIFTITIQTWRIHR